MHTPEVVILILFLRINFGDGIFDDSQSLINRQVTAVDPDVAVVRQRVFETGIFRVMFVHPIAPGRAGRFGSFDPALVADFPGSAQMDEVDADILRESGAKKRVIPVTVQETAGDDMGISGRPIVVNQRQDIGAHQLEERPIHRAGVGLAEVFPVDLDGIGGVGHQSPHDGRFPGALLAFDKDQSVRR